MAEGGEDKEQKTEQPTQKRLEEAHKRGQVPFSREVTNFLLLAVLALTIAGYAPEMLKKTGTLLTPFLARPDLIPADKASLGQMLMHLASGALLILSVPLIGVIVAAIGSSLAQNGFLLSNEPIMPKLEKISIRKGIERLFSMRAFIEFIKGLIKIGIVGIVAWMAVESQMNHVKQMMDGGIIAMLLFLSTLAIKLMVGVCIAMFFIALADLMYQRFSYTKSLRMSKQELKEEYKQQEGDPHVKQRLRRIRMERARKRMMAEVPKSDVVITNPTHFAVALKYESDAMQAPKVTAKGMDHMALTMRKIAKEHDVTIVENPPLARALYDAVEVDEEIPVQHYQAVAEIISYVYRLKGKLPAGAEPPRPTKL